MENETPPLRLDPAGLATSPPLRGVEDQPARTPPPILHPTQWGGGAEQGEAEGGPAHNPSRSRRKPGTTERARALRWRDNGAEGLLWQELKGRRLGGFQFTRQFPSGPYFADFCCRKRMLVVEVDGSQHAWSSHDRGRDEFMRQRGYSTLRVWNHDVLMHRGAVCDTILAALCGRLAEDVAAPDLRFVHAATTTPPNGSVQPSREEGS